MIFGEQIRRNPRIYLEFFLKIRGESEFHVCVARQLKRKSLSAYAERVANWDTKESDRTYYTATILTPHAALEDKSGKREEEGKVRRVENRRDERE